MPCRSELRGTTTDGRHDPPGPFFVSCIDWIEGDVLVGSRLIQMVAWDWRGEFLLHPTRGLLPPLFTNCQMCRVGPLTLSRSQLQLHDVSRSLAVGWCFWKARTSASLDPRVPIRSAAPRVRCALRSCRSKATPPRRCDRWQRRRKTNTGMVGPGGAPTHSAGLLVIQCIWPPGAGLPFLEVR